MNGPDEQFARRLTGLAARRPGLAFCLWGEPGIGKTHTALAWLRGTPLKSVSVHATQTAAAMVHAIPKPKAPSVWLERSVERVLNGEPLETNASRVRQPGNHGPPCGVQGLALQEKIWARPPSTTIRSPPDPSAWPTQSPEARP